MTLLFIYNANSGPTNTLLDVGHKLFSPSTYKCNLCTLTYGIFTENAIWKAFRKDSNLKMEFYHKDEFESKFPNVNMIYPSVLKLEGHQLFTVLTPEVLNEITSVELLIAQLKIKI